MLDIGKYTDILIERIGLMFDALFQDFEDTKDQYHYPFIKRHNRRFLKKLMREKQLFLRDPELHPFLFKKLLQIYTIMI